MKGLSEINTLSECTNYSFITGNFIMQSTGYQPARQCF